jgi:ABC-type multidrug transport system ATPase subunit
MPNVIEVEDLKKSFGEFEAVKGVSFSVEEGTTAVQRSLLSL